MQISSIFVLLVVVFFTFVSVTNGKICSNPSNYYGQVLCDFLGGHCGDSANFVKVCTGDGRATNQWKRGVQARGAGIPYGTAIGTFTNGTYSGHAAIYAGEGDYGIEVWDQWPGHLVSLRTIIWNGNGILNNGSGLYVIN